MKLCEPLIPLVETMKPYFDATFYHNGSIGIKFGDVPDLRKKQKLTCIVIFHRYTSTGDNEIHMIGHQKSPHNFTNLTATNVPNSNETTSKSWNMILYKVETNAHKFWLNPSNHDIKMQFSMPKFYDYGTGGWKRFGIAPLPETLQLSSMYNNSTSGIDMNDIIANVELRNLHKYLEMKILYMFDFKEGLGALLVSILEKLSLNPDRDHQDIMKLIPKYFIERGAYVSDFSDSVFVDIMARIAIDCHSIDIDERNDFNVACITPNTNSDGVRLQNRRARKKRKRKGKNKNRNINNKNQNKNQNKNSNEKDRYSDGNSMDKQSTATSFNQISNSKYKYTCHCQWFSHQLTRENIGLIIDRWFFLQLIVVLW